jgi:CheY-like chemotaxis protein
LTTAGVNYVVASPRILVADDDSKFLRFVTDLLTGAGYDVWAASDPSRVVEMAGALSPELIVLDISMPGKDGFEVARDLRRNPKTQAVRVLFITGHRSSTHVRRAKEVGGAGYLEKPLKSSTLIWMLKTLLADRPESGRPSGAADRRE